MMNTMLQSKLSRWSFAAAMFGASSNLLFLIVHFYQDDSWQHIRPDDWRNFILVTAITLAPSLVLFAFRHYFAVSFIYASVLFLILVWRIEYPPQYYVGRKYDDPGVTLVFLGLISAAVFSVWTVTRSFAFLWRLLKSYRAEL
jgi:hypothetical protein